MYIKRIINVKTNDASTNMTVRDNKFELLVDNKTNMVDKNGVIVNSNELNNKYKIFTFNEIENEYLALEKNSLVRINSDYNEFSSIPFSNIPIKYSEIKDIYYDKNNNKILVASNNKVFSVDYNGNYLKNEINNIDFFESNVVMDGCKVVTQIVPSDFKYTAVCTDNTYKYVTYKKNNSSFLARLSNNGTKIDELFIDDDVNINSIGINDGLYLNGIKDGNNIIYEISSSEDFIAQDIIDSLNNLITKISFSEEAISNIINAEASKVNKVISETSDTDKILKVNESILPVISEVTTIEQYERSNMNDIIRLINELLKLINN